MHRSGSRFNSSRRPVKDDKDRDDGAHRVNESVATMCKCGKRLGRPDIVYCADCMDLFDRTKPLPRIFTFWLDQDRTEESRLSEGFPLDDQYSSGPSSAVANRRGQRRSGTGARTAQRRRTRSLANSQRHSKNLLFADAPPVPSLPVIPGFSVTNPGGEIISKQSPSISPLRIGKEHADQSRRSFNPNFQFPAPVDETTGVPLRRPATPDRSLPTSSNNTLEIYAPHVSRSVVNPAPHDSARWPSLRRSVSVLEHSNIGTTFDDFSESCSTTESEVAFGEDDSSREDTREHSYSTREERAGHSMGVWQGHNTMARLPEVDASLWANPSDRYYDRSSISSWASSTTLLDSRPVPPPSTYYAGSYSYRNMNQDVWNAVRTLQDLEETNARERLLYRRTAVQTPIDSSPSS